MTYRSTAPAVAAAAAALISLAALAPASYAAETPDGGLRASYHPTFKVGDRLQQGVDPEIIDQFFGMLGWGAQLHFQTGGGDTTLQELRVADEPTLILDTTSTKGSVGVTVSNYDGEQGGDSQRTTGWQVANQSLGANNGWVTSAGSAIIDTDGEVQASGQVGTIGTQAYSGHWVYRSGDALPAGTFIGRTAAVSKTPGESMSIDVDVDRGAHFALIMRKSQMGGHASLYLDGQFVRSIDLRANGPTTRIVADVRLPAGSHTVAVTNTSANSETGQRVLLDAFLLAAGYVSPSVMPGPGFAS